MKMTHSRIGLAKLCGWFGVTRQAYYQHGWNQMDTSIEDHLVVQKVLSIRASHPRIGGRKLFQLLEPFLNENQIKMGRDAFFDVLSGHNLLIKRRKRKVHTTNSHHWLRKYPNLIRNFVPTGVDQLWVSDITYWKINGRHIYISFITDAFSRKIVGYHLAETLDAIESLKALKMATRGMGSKVDSNLVHHSDRGIQYCSKQYVRLLKAKGIGISMTENGDPLENAIAERINGIIKDEYLFNYRVNSLRKARELLRRSVQLYNNERPHMSIDNFTPNFVHENQISTNRKWKNYYQKKPCDVNRCQDIEASVNLSQD